MKKPARDAAYATAAARFGSAKIGKTPPEPKLTVRPVKKGSKIGIKGKVTW